MAVKGNCEQGTKVAWNEYIKWITDFSDLRHTIRTKDTLLGKILKDHAERIDRYERRLILLEDRVYKGNCLPDNPNGSRQFAKRAQEK